MAKTVVGLFDDFNDALTRVKLQEQLLDTWSREQRTVMFITHDVDEAVFLANRVVVMAARPGRIYDVVPVDLPYPRTEEFRLSREFSELRNRVWHSVYHQDGRSAADSAHTPALLHDSTSPAPSSSTV